MSNRKIIETLNSNSIAFLLLAANLLLLWIPIYTFVRNPKIVHYGLIYLLFILAANSSETIKRLFDFPGSVSMFSYFEMSKFVLSLNSLTFFVLWIFKNLDVAYLVYSILIIISIIVYFYEIIMYPKFLRNQTYISVQNNARWKRQEENKKLRELQRWNNLSSEEQCDEICKDIKNYIDENQLNNANSLIEDWSEKIIDFKGSNYFNNLIKLYNNRVKQNRKESSREYNWQCSKCGMHIKQHHEPIGKCNNYNVHHWVRL